MGYSTVTTNTELLLYVSHVGTLSEQLAHIPKQERVLHPQKVQTMVEDSLRIKITFTVIFIVYSRYT